MNTKIRKTSIFVSAMLFLALTLGLALPLQTALAATLCVNPGGTGGCYATIQAAVNAAIDGDTINVATGIYDGTIDIVNRHNLTLVGEDKTTTIIKSSSVIGWGLGYGTSRNTVIRVETSTGITMQNFTIDLDLVKGNNVAAYLGWDSTGTLDNNIFKNSSIVDSLGSYYELGVYLRAPGYTDVSRATYSVTNNTFYNMGRVALVTHGFLNTTITGNTFYKDLVDFGYAIEMGSESTGTISNNIIYGFNTPAATDGSNSAGIYIENAFTSADVTAIAKNVTISNNEIYDCQWALYIGNEFDGYAGNVDILASVTDNNFHDNTDGAVLVTDEDKTAGSSVTANFNNNTLTSNGTYGYEFYTSGDGNLTVNIQGGSITGSQYGVYMNDYGTPPSGSTYNVTIQNTQITGNTVAIQNDYADATINGSPNWWGAASGPGTGAVVGTVDYAPWYIDAAMTSLVPVHNVTKDIYYLTIQAAITAANPTGDTISVAAGTYDEDLTINKSLSLLGAGAGSSTIRGVIGGGGATIQVGGSNVTIAGFTITRLGNNLTDWNNAGLNTAGIAVQGAANSGMLVHDNLITGMRTGIDINASSGHTIRNNVISDNRTGMIMRNQTDNLTVVENEITNNWTVGVLFLDASSGSNIPLQTALNCTFSNNNLTGNWYGQVVDRQTGGSLPLPGANLKNFSGNWFGTTTPVVSTANSAEPAYAALIPVEFGGTSVAPGGQPDILGPASANIDFTPFLNFGTDTDVETTSGRGTYGFQGNFSNLWITAASAQTGTTGRIQEGIDTVSGSTVNIAAGTYIDNVVVDKTVTIVGAGAGSTIIQPAISDPAYCDNSSLCGGHSSNVFLIQADNVIIHDLTVDGDNPALSTSGKTSGGLLVDARNGIIKNTNATYNNLEVYNVTVQNIYLRGIYSTGGSFNFHDNTVTNVYGGTSSIAIFAWGGPGIMNHNTVSYASDAVSANHSNGIQFLNNTVTFSGSGVHTDNAGDSGGVADLIQGNHVDCTGVTNGYGVWVFVPYIAPIVNNNTVTNCAVGLSAWGSGATVIPQFTNNTATGDGSANSAGIYISTDWINYGYSDINVNFTGNTISGFDYGIELEAGDHSYWYTTPVPYAAHTITATFSNNQISGNTIGLAENVDSNPPGGTYLVSASPNWWGDPSGPSGAGTGTGDSVVPTDVDFDPWCLNASCSNTQPPLPSSFVGYIRYYTGTATGSVDAFVPAVTPAVRSATIVTDGGFPAYQMDVPGDAIGLSGKDGGVEGDLITFKIGTRVIGTHAWHSGTNVLLTFHPPEAVTGGEYYGLKDATISFNGSANDWLTTDTFTYAWDLDGIAGYETAGPTPTHSWSTVGDYPVGLQVTDSLGAVATATTTVHIASISSPLGGLSAVYDGSPHAASATTNPSGLTMSFTYNGLPTAPTAAGTYAVIATIPGYTGSVTGSLVISKATSTVTVTCPTEPQTYTGSAITPCTAAYSGAGSLSGPLNPTYLNNVNVGTATANATYAGDANHTGSSNSNTFTIAKATATITLSNMNPVYDGSAKSPTVTTVPAGLAYTISYNGSPDAPLAPGTYTIVVTINDSNYSGSATGTMYIQSTHSLTLVPGWNLVSFNLVPMDTLTGTVLANIAGKYDLVYGWDGTQTPSNAWKKYAPGGPAYANSLSDLHETMGFWIHVTSPSNITLNVNGNAPASTSITLSTGAGGWNLVGFPSASGALGVTDLPGALSVTDFSLVYAYHAFDTADQWKLFDNTPGIPAFANDLKFLSPGWGYWVKVGSNQTWEVTY